MKKRLSLLLCVLLTVAMLTGCGAESGYPMESRDEGYYEMPEAEESVSFSNAQKAAGSGADGELARQSDAKMIYTADLRLETTEFDRTDAEITALVKRSGGYFEQRSLSNRTSQYRSASYVIRVPAEKFEDFCAQAGKLGHLAYSGDSAENITEEYYDTQSRLDTAKIKLERLQDLLRQATSMSDIIELENAISDTEYQIDWLSGTLRHYDALVDYSTVTVELDEVYKLSGAEAAPQTFGERLGSAFRSGLSAAGSALEGIAVALAYSWVGLLICAVVVIVAVRIVRGRKKKAAQTAPAVPAPPAAPAPERKEGE